MNNATTRSDKNSTDRGTDQELHCEHCDRRFGPKQALRIRVRGPHSAGFSCPRCKRLVWGTTPDDINRPPPIVGNARKIDDELVTARAFFRGGAYLQFRETPKGWVREEMFNEDSDEIESFPVELDRDNCDPPMEYLDRELKRYPTYTITGLRLERPHIAAVLIHGH